MDPASIPTSNTTITLKINIISVSTLAFSSSEALECGVREMQTQTAKKLEERNGLAHSQTARTTRVNVDVTTMLCGGSTKPVYIYKQSSMQHISDPTARNVQHQACIPHTSCDVFAAANKVMWISERVEMKLAYTPPWDDESCVQGLSPGAPGPAPSQLQRVAGHPKNGLRVHS